MAIKEDRDADLIFTERNGITLEVYNNDVNTHYIITRVDNNYNNYNSNDTSYEDGTNNKEDVPTYEDGAGVNTTHEGVTNCSEKPPVSYDHETINNNAVYEIPGI